MDRSASLDSVELEKLLASPESDRVERKESLRGDAREGIRRAICAFANDLPGRGLPGVIFVGVRDDGAPAGLDIDDELLRNLADMRGDGNILPLPSMRVTKEWLAGSPVAVVCVYPADAPPVRYRGRTYIRTGPRADIASRQDERVLNERRRARDQPFDLSLIRDATLADFDLDLFTRRYLPGALSPEVLAANERTTEERLAGCRMVESVDSPVPTLVGVLALAAQPDRFVSGQYVQFLRLDGNDLAAPIVDAQRLSGPLGDIVRDLDAKMASHLRTRVDITSSAVEQRSSSYPISALQQLTRNALVHRSFERTHAPVRVTWYDDRIEIISPGGPFGTVDAHNFGRPGIAEYRNPNVAEAMRVLGFVQRFGVGIALAQKALRDNGSDPARFTVDATHVIATVPRRPS